MLWPLFLLVCCVRAEKRLVRPRVHQGQEDTNNEFPFAVSLQNRGGLRICTCSLIADNWVITAGHCIKKNFKNKRIRYADFTLNETNAYSEIINAFRHPGFFLTEIGSTVINDLGLMLIEKVPSKAFAKVSAIDYRGLMGLSVKYAGFGLTVENRYSLTENEGDSLRGLQTGEAVVVPCAHVWPMYGPAICVAPRCSNKYQDTRAGDSGGPLVYNGKIVGVLTGSVVEEPISFYAPVSPDLRWISDVMKRNS